MPRNPFRVKIEVRVGRFRGAKGIAFLGQIMDNEHERKLAESRRNLKRASAYARQVMRNGMRPGRTKRVKIDKRVKDARGVWKTRSTWAVQRTRSRPGKPPLYHNKGGGFGFKWIWFGMLGGDPYTYEIGPEFRRTKGSKNVNFRIDRMHEKGGMGRVRMPVVHATPMAIIKSAGPQFHMVPARYPKRSIVRPALAPTLRKFRTIWGYG